MIKVEHEIHQRRKGRNMGVGILLLGMVAIVFGLTVVKVTNLGAIEKFDHVYRPAIDPTIPVTPSVDNE